MPSIFIATKNKSKTDMELNDARELILYIDAISAIGEENGLMRLDEFIYAPLEEISDFLVKTGASKEELEKAYEDIWFEPKVGKDLVERYINLVRNYHSLSETTKSKIIPELENFKHILKTLVEENNMWRLQYDI